MVAASAGIKTRAAAHPEGLFADHDREIVAAGCPAVLAVIEYVRSSRVASATAYASTAPVLLGLVARIDGWIQCVVPVPGAIG
jgi:hypothetical protein